MTEHDEQQDRVLERHEYALHELEQRLPEVDTARGADQRWRVHIPSPATQLVLGARGQNPPIGPRGVGLYTQYNFGCEVHQHTCFHSLSNLIAHSGWTTGLFAGNGFVLSSNQALRVGTVGDVEITAGEAGFADVNYTVLSPAADVPEIDDFEVDVAGPRGVAEAFYWSVDSLSKGWSIFSAFRSIVPVARAAVRGTRPRARVLHGVINSFVSGAEAAYAVGESLAIGLDLIDAPDSDAAGMKLHAAGDMKLTATNKATVFGVLGASVVSLKSVAIKAVYKVEMKAAGVAKVWGGTAAALKSEGVTSVAGKVLNLKGKNFAMLNGKTSLSLGSEGELSINSKGDIELTADKAVALTSGEEMDICGKTHLYLDSDHDVEVCSGGTLLLEATDALDIESDKSVKVHVGNNHLEIEEPGIRLKAGAAQVLLKSGKGTLKSGSSEVEVTSSGVRIRGRNIRMG